MSLETGVEGIESAYKSGQFSIENFQEKGLGEKVRGLGRDLVSGIKGFGNSLSDMVHSPGRLRKEEGAFTIIELLVVISTIGILAGMLLPALGRAREQARTAKCMSNMKQIATAINVYSAQNDGIMPCRGQIGTGVNNSEYRLWFGGQPTMLGLLYKGNFIKDPRVFFCPEATNFTESGTYGMQKWGIGPGPNNYVASSYLYRGESGSGEMLIDKVTGPILIDYDRFADTNPARNNMDHNFGHMILGYPDGHSQRVDSSLSGLAHTATVTWDDIWNNAKTIK